MTRARTTVRLQGLMGRDIRKAGMARRRERQRSPQPGEPNWTIRKLTLFMILTAAWPSPVQAAVEVKSWQLRTVCGVTQYNPSLSTSTLVQMPFAYTQSAASTSPGGYSATARSLYDFQDAPQSALFHIAVDHARESTSGSFAQSPGLIVFRPTEAVAYAVKGSYTLTGEDFIAFTGSCRI